MAPGLTIVYNLRGNSEEDQNASNCGSLLEYSPFSHPSNSSEPNRETLFSSVRNSPSHPFSHNPEFSFLNLLQFNAND